MDHPPSPQWISSETARTIVIVVRTAGALAVILLCLGSVLIVLVTLVSWIRNLLARPIMVSASVARKWERCSVDLDDGPWDDHDGRSMWSLRDLLRPIAERTNIPWLDKFVWPSSCYIAFRTARGFELEFEVPGEFYITVTEGDEGFLEYKGESFSRFVSRQLQWRSE